MRRDEIIRATRRITTDLRETGLFSMLNRPVQELRARPDSKNDAAWFDLSIYQQFVLRSATYTDVELAIFDIFNLTPLMSTQFWEGAVKGLAADDYVVVRNALRFALEYLPKLTALLERESDTLKQKPGDMTGILSGKEIITIILPEGDGQYSAPDRFIYAVSALSDLYSVLSAIEGRSHTDLILLSCDSGSDKLFDFAGLPETVGAIKDLILGLWDRVVLYRHNQTQASFALIASSLPIIDQLDTMEKSGSMDSETCALMKHKIVSASVKFLEAGAITPEMSDNATQSPRLLMTPQPKLLAAPTSAAEARQEQQGGGGRSENSDQLGDLTPEQLARLKAMLREDDGSVSTAATPPRRAARKPPRK